MIGMTLITAQTGPEGRVQKVLVEEGPDIRRELYLELLRSADGPACLYGLHPAVWISKRLPQNT